MKNQKLIQANQTIEKLLFSDLEFPKSFKKHNTALDTPKEKHHRQIFEIGMQWLEIRFEFVPSNQWRFSSNFWHWWKKQWSIRNFEILMQLGFELDEESITQSEFEALHDAFKEIHDMSIQSYPQRQVVRSIAKEFKTVKVK